MKLRVYQTIICDKIQDKLLNYDTVVSSLAGGGGKSLVISELARRYSSSGQSVCILTNITALIPQLSHHLSELGIAHNIVKSGMSQQEDGCLVHLIMEQSFHEDKRNELKLHCDILIKDEFHIGIGQKRFEAIRSHLKPTSTIGLTFTPLDELGYLLKGLERNQIIDDGNAYDLTEQGYLCPIKYFIPKWAEDIDYSDVGASGNDYNGQEIDKIVSQDNHLDLIVKSMNEMDAKNKNVLVYASSIENAELINAKLIDNGYESNVFHSKTNENDSGVSLDTLKLFERHSVIVSVMMLGIGFDSPRANLLVMLRPTKVKRLAMQILARASRTSDGKEYAEILDLAQCVRNHGFLTDEIEYITQGDKKALEKSKAKNQLNVGVVLEDDKPTQVTRELVLAKLEEIRVKARTNLTVKEMIGIFENSMDFEVIMDLSHKIYSKATGIEVKPNTVNWVSEHWNNTFEKYPENKIRWIKSFKSRIKSIVQLTMKGEEKKFAGIYFFANFLVDSIDKYNNWHAPNH